MLAAMLDQDFLTPADAEAVLADVARQMKLGKVIPFLGPGLTELVQPTIPLTPEALAAFFGTKVALPRRAKGNPWSAAQHIESTRHRQTVSALMNEAFSPVVEPTPLLKYLASLPLPVLIDTWYDGAARLAFADRSDWGEVQGITRSGLNEDRWYRFYDASGAEVDKTVAETWKTILYKPHGGATPAKNFLISDADYVEVLTEIDIQTPIPDIIKDRRTERNFLFIGCRFHDQLLRTYARQLSKRSVLPQYAVVDPALLSKNERRFFATQGLVPLAIPLQRATEIILAA